MLALLKKLFASKPTPAQTVWPFPAPPAADRSVDSTTVVNHAVPAVKAVRKPRTPRVPKS